VTKAERAAQREADRLVAGFVLALMLLSSPGGRMLLAERARERAWPSGEFYEADH
jgi:hypothetical protein